VTPGLPANAISLSIILLLSSTFGLHTAVMPRLAHRSRRPRIRGRVTATRRPARLTDHGP
jgi:hypothetical protein